MEFSDDELIRFESDATAVITGEEMQGTIDHDGAAIWYATHGVGHAVVLLHGGLGHSGNWFHQVPALVEAGYRVVVVDSRGHGRSLNDDRPFSYRQMSSDVLAVLDNLHIRRASLIGWSDGACTALILASQLPARVSGVFYFACNMNPNGAKENFQISPTVERCLSRHIKDYAFLSQTPGQFDEFAAAVRRMQQSEPNYSAEDLAAIGVPVLIIQAEHDEFIKAEHANYLARAIPNADLLILTGVSHFAPLQRPGLFNAAMLEFLSKTCAALPSPEAP